MFDSVTAANIIAILAIIFISTALHEMMHAYVALRLGDDLAYLKGRISLNPIRHIDPFLTVLLPFIMLLMGATPILAAKPVPINVNRVRGRENGMALIGIAGPLTNLVLAIAAAGILRSFGGSGVVTDFGLAFVSINVSLFLFNMLPLPPLDGSRLLYAFAPEPVQRVMEQVEGFGVFGVIILVTLLSPILGPILGNWHASIMNLLIP